MSSHKNLNFPFSVSCEVCFIISWFLLFIQKEMFWWASRLSNDSWLACKPEHEAQPLTQPLCIHAPKSLKQPADRVSTRSLFNLQLQRPEPTDRKLLFRLLQHLTSLNVESNLAPCSRIMCQSHREKLHISKLCSDFKDAELHLSCISADCGG